MFNFDLFSASDERDDDDDDGYVTDLKYEVSAISIAFVSTEKKRTRAAHGSSSISDVTCTCDERGRRPVGVPNGEAG